MEDVSSEGSRAAIRSIAQQLVRLELTLEVEDDPHLSVLAHCRPTARDWCVGLGRWEQSRDEELIRWVGRQRYREAKVDEQLEQLVLVLSKVVARPQVSV